MIKLICPQCMKPVQVPDEYSGAQFTCPSCGKQFDVPSRYSPAVLSDAPPPPQPEPPAAVPTKPPEPSPMSSDVLSYPPERPAPPPGFVPPAPPTMSAATVPTIAGYTHARGFSITVNGVAWLTAVFLVLILALTFFDWIGSYVGGSAVYSQNAWRAISGHPYRNFPMENKMKQEAAWPPEVFNKTDSDWKVMVPFILVLFVATALAWCDRGISTLHRERLPQALQWIASMWPHRVTVLAALVTSGLVLILIQAGNGFGLERALRDVVSTKFAEDRQKAAGDPSKLETIASLEDEALARFTLERTTWFYLVILLQIVITLAMALRIILQRRGNKPPPKILLHY